MVLLSNNQIYITLEVYETISQLISQVSGGCLVIWVSVQSDQSSLSVWRKLGSLASHWAHSEDWSEWADAHADVSLRWAHSHFVGQWGLAAVCDCGTPWTFLLTFFVMRQLIYIDIAFGGLPFSFLICEVINKFVDKCYNLKTIESKTKCAKCINTGLFWNLHPKLYTILTSGSAINEVWSW